jgi:hypothetical protein
MTRFGKSLSCASDYETSALPERGYSTGHNLLADRLLNVPLFPQRYVDKFTEWLRLDFTKSVLEPLIVGAHQE